MYIEVGKKIKKNNEKQDAEKLQKVKLQQKFRGFLSVPIKVFLEYI